MGQFTPNRERVASIRFTFECEVAEGKLDELAAEVVGHFEGAILHYAAFERARQAAYAAAVEAKDVVRKKAFSRLPPPLITAQRRRLPAEVGQRASQSVDDTGEELSLIHISEPTRPY